MGSGISAIHIVHHCCLMIAFRNPLYHTAPDRSIPGAVCFHGERVKQETAPCRSIHQLSDNHCFCMSIIKIEHCFYKKVVNQEIAYDNTALCKPRSVDFYSGKIR